jgi:hypothetical protein
MLWACVCAQNLVIDAGHFSVGGEDTVDNEEERRAVLQHLLTRDVEAVRACATAVVEAGRTPAILVQSCRHHDVMLPFHGRMCAQVDAEVVDDEQLNEMLARDESEMELYTRMDQDEEQYWRSVGVPRPPRLVTVRRSRVVRFYLISP